MTTLLAGAAQTWPEFQIDMIEGNDGRPLIRYAIKARENDAWINVERDVYLAALETSKLSAAQDIASLLDRIASQWPGRHV